MGCENGIGVKKRTEKRRQNSPMTVWAGRSEIYVRPFPGPGGSFRFLPKGAWRRSGSPWLKSTSQIQTDPMRPYREE